MKRPFKGSSILLVLLLLVAFGLYGNAQTPLGTIAGAVTDPTGAAIPSAAVTATSLQTNEKRTAATNGAGSYRIESLLPGTYKIETTAPSFGSTNATVQVNSSVVTSVNLTLQAGTESTTVDISSSGELLKTDGAELSNTLSTLEVSALPVNNLNPYALATTLPGVTAVKSVDLTNGTSFAVNGSRPRDNNFLIEGADNNDQGIHGQAFQPNNLESVQDVTFLLNSFTAEYGHGGSVSNLVFRSGSNQFHGAVWNRLYNSSLNATDHNDVLNGNPKAKSRENIFGFRFGGPIIKDKLFFFGSTQWDRLRETANLGVLTIPTAAGYAKLQQYSSNPRVANLLTAYGSLRGTNPNFARTLALGRDPVTGVDRGSVDFAGAQRSLGRLTNGYETVAKVDYLVSQNDKLQFRYIHSPLTVPFDTDNFPNQLAGFDTQQSGTVDNAGIVETHIFSPAVLNEARLTWSRIGFTFGLRPETQANPLAITPGISITGITGYGVPTSVPQGRFQNTYVLQDSLSWNKGRHFIKVGFDLSDIRVRDQVPFNFYGAISYGAAPAAGFTSLANYLDDFGGTASNTATITFGNPVARPEIWSQNYYAQDSWKIRPNISLDFGIRYEYNGTPFNYLGYPGFDSSNPTCFPCTVRQQADGNNIAPRLGFNYSPFTDGKTVISGGFGLFYDHVFTNIIDNIQASSPNAAAKNVVSSTAGRGTAAWSGALARITNKNPLATDSSNVIASNLTDPENYQWNLRIQQQLPAAFVVTGTYVGNRGVHQYATTEFNPLLNGTGVRLFRTRGRIIRQDNTNDSIYHSGQVQVEHKTTHGLTMRANYSYSKMMDTGSELFTPSGTNWSTYAERQYPSPRGLEWAPSAFDQRNVFSMSYVYTPPVWHADGAARFAAAVVNRWMISGIGSWYSGSPVTTQIGYDFNGDGILNDRPQLANPNAPLNTWAIQGDDFFNVSPGTLCEGSAAFNTDDDCHPVSINDVHWVTEHYGTQGNNIRRNDSYAPRNQQWDMAAQRSFHLPKTPESHLVDFRAESFNVFNHALTNQPGGFTVNSTLVTGAFASPALGQNTFRNYGLTNSGGRTLRFLLKYSF